MRKWIIVAIGIAVAIVVLAAVAFTFTQEAKGPDPGSGDVGFPRTEKPSDTLDAVGIDFQTHGSIAEVKDAWEEQLMAIPGVMGVGIGLTADGQEKAIKVYLNRGSSEQAVRIPEEINGYPVEVEIRNTFRAWK